VLGAHRRPDPDPPAWQRSLDRPESGLRQGLATTGLDGEPDHIVTLPGHSLWPLWASVALAVALIGVLVDGVALGIVGLVGLIAASATWLWPGVE
jgi:cytochrome c oxidase subunit I+III